MNMHAKTVKELRAIAKERGLRGYSRLRKSDLVALLAGDAVLPKREPTVADLRTQCKERGMRGYSRLTKPALVKLLGTAPPTDEQQIVAAIAALPSTIEETRAVYRYLAGSKSPEVKRTMASREARAIASIRDQQTCQRDWQRWHARYLVATGAVC